MSLPDGYDSVKKYFSEVLHFLRSHQWLYNFPNTSITVNNLLDNIPVEWVEFSQRLTVEEFSNLTQGTISDDCPHALKCLLEKNSGFKPTYVTENTNTLSLKSRSNVNPKKLHEIAQFAQFVNRVCIEKNIQYFIDIGAGLGYLSQLLFEQYNYKVLGIEGSQKNVQAAKVLQTKVHLSSVNHVKYKHLYVTEKSGPDLLDFLISCFPEFNPGKDRCAIIGLHACADLSVNMLRLFIESTFTDCLILMPCCYHRIEMKNKDGSNFNLHEEQFAKFPVSDVLTKLFVEFEASSYLRRPFLRMACQQSDVTWSKLDDNQRKIRNSNCLFRAILQEITELEGLRISRNKRKTGTTTSFSIDSIIANLERNYSFARTDNTNHTPVDIANIKEGLLAKWSTCHARDLPAIETFCSLQSALQGLCENIVLLDRVEHVRELGVDSCRVTKITDQHISPRCYAIVAIK